MCSAFFSHMASLSLCMIAKNEESCIKQCLLSVKGLVDEMIVVDTGSTDRTVEIAASCGAQVYHFPWNGSFSDARNESLKHATKDWILVLDADEVISAQDHATIRQMLHNNDADAFMLIQRNYTNDAARLRWEACDKRYTESKDFYGFVPCPICRLFKNKPEHRYKYKIHEMVNEAIIGNKGIIKLINIPIHHYKAFKTKEETIQKADKYCALLEQQIRENPHDPKTYYEYGQLLLNLKRPAEAIAALKKVVELEKYAGHAYSKIGFLHYLLAQACLQITANNTEKGDTPGMQKTGEQTIKEQETKEATEEATKEATEQAIQWLNQGIQINPVGKECYLLLSHIFISTQRLRDALDVIEAALSNKVHDAAIYNTLGIIYIQLGLVQDAITTFTKGKQLNKGISPAIEKINNNLFACYLQLGQGEAAVQLLESASNEAPRIASYHANLAQWYGRNGKYQQARERLKKIQELYPEKEGYISLKIQELNAMEQAGAPL